jgi:hypothetical protein
LLSALAAAALVLLSACGSTPPPPKYPDVSFGHLPPFRLAVARIDIVNEYREPMKKPNVEHEFPIAPGRAAERWVRDRLQAGGGDGYAKVTIKEASAVETILRKKTEGLRGALTTEPSERYDVAIELIVEVSNNRGNRDGIEGRYAAHRSVLENISLNDREKTQYELVKTTIEGLNDILDREVKRRLMNWLM